jgi:hypothetical protein
MEPRRKNDNESLDAWRIALAGDASDAQPGPFMHRVRVWSGGERPILSDERGARNRCRASYVIGGGGVAMGKRLRCAEISIYEALGLLISGGVTKRWSETTDKIAKLASGGSLDALRPQHAESLWPTSAEP